MQLGEFLGIFFTITIVDHIGDVTAFYFTEDPVSDSIFDPVNNDTKLSLRDLLLPNFNFNFSDDSDSIMKGVLLGGRCNENWECQIWDENAHCYPSYFEDVPSCHCKMGYKRNKYQCHEIYPVPHKNYFLAKEDLRTMVLIIAITVGMAAIGVLILFTVKKCRNNESSSELQDFRRISVNSQYHLNSHDQVVINAQDLVISSNNTQKPPSYEGTDSSPPSYEIAIVSEEHSQHQILEKVPMNILKC